MRTWLSLLAFAACSSHPASPSNQDAAPGSDGGAHPTCKRGVAANTAPGSAFSPALSWTYDWSLTSAGGSAAIEFDPMVWGKASVGSAVPAGTKYLLGFNEPNFDSGATLTAAQAAAYWPMIEAQAKGAKIVSPAVNFCGPASQCNQTDPYQYLKDFFSDCPGCQVDYVAVHWYNCDLPSLQDYLEPGGNLEGFVQFNRPIWLTEFSCDTTASVADQEAYMKQAIPYLEGNPNVFRYSWFSAGPIPNAELINSDGSPTALGQVYIDLAEICD
jgi:Glycosyl hydrolase catalytic core